MSKDDKHRSEHWVPFAIAVMERGRNWAWADGAEQRRVGFTSAIDPKTDGTALRFCGEMISAERHLAQLVRDGEPPSNAILAWAGRYFETMGAMAAALDGRAGASRFADCLSRQALRLAVDLPGRPALLPASLVAQIVGSRLEDVDAMGAVRDKPCFRMLFPTALLRQPVTGAAARAAELASVERPSVPPPPPLAQMFQFGEEQPGFVAWARVTAIPVDGTDISKAQPPVRLAPWSFYEYDERDRRYLLDELLPNLGRPGAEGRPPLINLEGSRFLIELSPITEQEIRHWPLGADHLSVRHRRLIAAVGLSPCLPVIEGESLGLAVAGAAWAASRGASSEPVIATGKVVVGERCRAVGGTRQKYQAISVYRHFSGCDHRCFGPAANAGDLQISLSDLGEVTLVDDLRRDFLRDGVLSDGLDPYRKALQTRGSAAGAVGSADPAVVGALRNWLDVALRRNPLAPDDDSDGDPEVAAPDEVLAVACPVRWNQDPGAGAVEEIVARSWEAAIARAVDHDGENALQKWRPTPVPVDLARIRRTCGEGYGTAPLAALARSLPVEMAQAVVTAVDAASDGKAIVSRDRPGDPGRLRDHREWIEGRMRCSRRFILIVHDSNSEALWTLGQQSVESGPERPAAAPRRKSKKTEDDPAQTNGDGRRAGFREWYVRSVIEPLLRIPWGARDADEARSAWPWSPQIMIVVCSDAHVLDLWRDAIGENLGPWPAWKPRRSGSP